MVVVPVCLNDRCYSSGRVGIDRINKGKGDESLLAFRRDVVSAIFLKYSKKDRLSLSHVGIRNIPSHVCYDDKTLTGEI